MIEEHSSSSTPFVTSGWWFILLASKIFIDEPNAPPLISGAPYTTLLILDWIIAPEHIMHGSIVTYKVQSTTEAFLIAKVSACPKGLLVTYLWLCARAIIWSSLTMTQPIGTSSSSFASSASFKASLMYLISLSILTK